VFIVTDESKDDNRFAECPVCGHVYTFNELLVLQTGGNIRTVVCECEETVFHVSIDSKGNRVIDIRCLHDYYMNIQESR
jgi:transcription elongation factor Elf1